MVFHDYICVYCEKGFGTESTTKPSHIYRFDTCPKCLNLECERQLVNIRRELVTPYDNLYYSLQNVLNFSTSNYKDLFCIAKEILKFQRQLVNERAVTDAVREERAKRQRTE